MDTLFHLPSVFPPGFQYEEKFLEQDEERALLDSIRRIQLHAFQFQGFEAKRRVASFGYDYAFDKRTLKEGTTIPPEFDWLVRKVGGKAQVMPEEFKELLITEYPIGSVINWHRDAPPFGIVAGVSLAAPCEFKLRPHDKRLQTRAATRSLTVKPGSLYLIKDEARWNWQHSTAPVQAVRYSITLRTLVERSVG